MCSDINFDFVLMSVPAESGIESLIFSSPCRHGRIYGTIVSKLRLSHASGAWRVTSLGV